MHPGAPEYTGSPEGEQWQESTFTAGMRARAAIAAPPKMPLDNLLP